MEDFNLYALENSFYRIIKEYSKFRNLTDKRKNEIQKISDTFRNNNFTNNPLENYILTIKFLNSPKSRITKNGDAKKFNLYFYDYDEAVYFYIYTLDPDLEIAKMYLANEKSSIRKKMGFYNIYAVNFELEYIKKYYKELLTNVKHDLPNITSYIGRANNIMETAIKTFKLITQERYDLIKELAQKWNEREYENKANNCIFNAFYQSEIIGLKNDYEKILFIILALDPNYRLLQIFEEESNIEKIKERSLNELGFYISELIKSEDIIYSLFNTNVYVERFTI